MTTQTYNGTAAGFGAIASGFVMEAIGDMLPWLITMAAIIFADLISGIAKGYKLGERLRFSKAVRDSIAKFCTYYACVVCSCMTEIATGYDIQIARGACLLIIFIEATSIVGNIFKWHGYSVDFTKVLSIVFAKKIGSSVEEMGEIITKDDDDGKD